MSITKRLIIELPECHWNVAAVTKNLIMYWWNSLLEHYIKVKKDIEQYV